MSKPFFRAAGLVLVVFAFLAIPLQAQFISEIMFNSPGTDAPNEYVELRGTPNATIAAGTYLLGIEGDSGSPGDVQNIFDLSGKTFGSNGYLVLLQKANTYVTDANATVLTNSGTGAGFGSGAGSSIGHSADASATDIENDAVTFLLIQTGTPPTLTNDIDADNDGNADGAVYAGWTILDSVSVLNTTAGGRGYGAMVFRNGTNGLAPGATTTVTLGFTPGYVARIGRSTGTAAADWAAGVGAGTAPNFTMGASASPASMANFPLNHIGTENAPHVLSILRNSTNPTSPGSSIVFQVNFTRPVNNVDAADFVLSTTGGITGASITTVTGSGTPFDVTVNSGSGSGTIRLDLVDNDTIIIGTGSYPLGGVGLVNGDFNTGEVFTINAAAPTVTSIVRADPDPTNASVVNFTVTFSESVTGVDDTDFALDTTGVSGASIGIVTGANATWTVPVNTGTGDGTVSIDLIDNDSIINGSAVALGGSFTAGELYTIDKTQPSVQSINRAGTDPTSATSVDFTVTFSEDVNNVGTTNFTAVEGGGVSGSSVTLVTPVSDSVYTVSVNTGTGSGTIRLDLSNTASIIDDAGNGLSGTFTTGQLYTIDKNFPSVVSINRADTSPTNADDVDFTVTFSAAVSGVDAADFDLALSGVTAAINTVASSDGGTTWNVNVNSVVGDGTLGLDLDDDNSIVAVSNSAPLGGNAADDGDFTGQVYDIDNTAPAVVSSVLADANPTNASTVNFTVTFNDTVTGVGTDDFSLATPLTGTSVDNVTGTGSGPYTVTVSTGSGDGLLRLDVITNATITDDAGNAFGATYTGGFAYMVDKTAPSVQSVTRADADPTNAASVDFNVMFSEGVTGVDPLDFTLALTGVTGASITGVVAASDYVVTMGGGPPPPPPAEYVVTVNTGAGSGTIRLDVAANGSILDPANNALSGAFNTGEFYTLERAPLAPTALNATPGDGHILLNWNPANGAGTYSVKRSTTPGGPYGAPIATGIAATNYDDTTVVNGTTYYYVVFATNAQGDGPDSNEASATPSALLPAPTGLTARVGDAKVILNWNAVGGATTYNVKRGTTPGGPYPTTVGSPATTTFTDTTVVNATQYFYVVTAVGPESLPSNEVNATPNAPSALGVAISQLYGGGGNTGAPAATLKNDFIELYNRSTQTVDLTGWSVQYASATGTTWQVTTLTGVILPGRYYLIQEAAGTGGTVNLPPSDAPAGTINMGAGGGKTLLASQTAAFTGACPAGPTIADFAGWATTANCFEGSGPIGSAPNNVNSAQRAGNGCIDTNNNAADFAVAIANPRNSSISFICGSTPISGTGASSPSSVDPGNSSLLTVNVTPGGSPPSTGIAVVADLTQIGGSATQQFYDDGTTAGDVTGGDNIFSFNATVTVGTTAGAKSLPATITDAETRSASASIPLTVNPPLENILDVKVDTTPANTVPDRNGQLVRVRGVVTSIDFRGGNGIEYYIQDPTGGIDVFHTSTNFGPFTLGDSVDVTGTLTQFNGLTEISPTSVTPLAPGTVPPVTPQTVTLSAVNESLEGRLIRVDNLTMAPGALAGDTNYTINDGTNGTMRVDADTNIPGNNAPTTTFSLIGVVGQFDNTNPFDTGYQILPRSTADIIPRTAPTGVGAANPPSVPPGANTLLTVTVTPGQNPPSTGISVVVDLSSIGGSATQAFLDDGFNGDVAPGDLIYSYDATVNALTPLGPKSLPVTITDAEARGSATSIPLNVQSPDAPPTPANLTATPGNATVDLDWDPSLGATGYNVKRSTVSGGPYTTIASDIAADDYTDNSVVNGTTYYYVVSALSGANESGDSAQVSATPTAPPPEGPLAKIYFVDIGQGAGTLIVGPTGTSLLVDAGPTGQGNSKVLPLLNAVLPPGDKVDYTIVTHYHVDHDAGMTEVINAGMLDGGIAYDNGDAAHVVPPVPSNSTGTAFTAYKNAITSRAGAVTRTTITPGLVINLGGGMTATCLVAGGDLASGGGVYVSGTDLNSSSIATLIQYNDFDYLVSGDLTGGGSTTTAKTPDVETFVAQMAGDVDVVQLDHHGSTTANNRRFLGALKAEMSFASIGTSNTFGHPNREVVNRYLNTPATSGNTYPGEGVPNPGNGPVHYQTEASPPTDNRTTVQFHSGASAGNAGQGTLLLETDGVISFTLESFDDGGVRIDPALHVYAIDGAGAGVATDFPPTVIPFMSPGVPTAADAVTMTALVNDVQAITSVTLDYSLNGAAQAPVTMTPAGSEFSAVIPAQPNGTRVDFTITAVANGLTTVYIGGYFSGTTPVAALRSINALGEPTYLDYAARIAGLALSTTGDYSTSNNDDYVQDGTGSLNVSRTIEPDSPATQPVSVGNTYTVAGLINQLTGRLRLDVTPPFDGITKPWDAAPGSYNPFGIALTGSAAVTPETKTIAQILAAPEGHEAHLVSIANVTITSGTIPASGGLDAFLTINDGTGSMEMKIDSDGDIPGLATPAGSFTLVGIVQQDDFLRPFNARYTVAPRNRTDLGAAAGGPALITIAEAREDIDPTTFTSPDDFVPDRLGQQVKVRGVVTSVDFRSGSNGIEYYIQDPTAGIVVFDATVNLALNIGDSVEVVGTITHFNGLTEIDITNIADITTLAPGTMPPVNVEVVTLSQLADNGVGEIYEGKFLRINNVTLTSPPATFGANVNYSITDASGGPVQMRIDGDTNIDGTVPPSSPFSVIGVLGQFDTTDPRDSGYQFFPRMLTDFLPATPAAASITATAGTPQSATVSTAFATQLQATVLDGSNNPIEGIGVTFTAPGAGASGTFANSTTTTNATTNASGVATATVFTANGIAGAYNVVASTNSLTANFALTNTDPGATHFDVVAPASVTNGAAFNVTVTARDASNNVATSYTGTVHFTSSSAGTLPSDYTFTGGDAGVHTFSVTLTTNGSQSITATDTVDSQITGTTNTTVNNCDLPATPTISAPSTFACPAQPLTMTATSAGATSFQWYKNNSLLNGETASTYQTNSAGTYTVTATNSCGTTVQSAGYAVSNPSVGSPTISASSTMLCAGGTIVLSSSSATGIQWYRDNVAIPGANSPTYPATMAGTYHAVLTYNTCPSLPSNQIVLTASASPAPNADITAPSSILTGSTGHVASVADAGAGATYNWTIGGPGTLTSGQGTNSITFQPFATGTMTIHITVTLPGGCIDQKSKNVVVSNGTGVPTHFSVTAPANVTASTPFNVTVTALDNFNNAATSYTGTVHFTSSSAGTLPGDYTFTAGDNGAHTFSVTLTTNGTQSITVTDTANASITGTTNTNVSCPAVPAPTITPLGPTTFCAGGSVVLQSSSAAGLQWYRDGNPVGSGEQLFTVSVAGSYTATVTSNGCVSPASNAIAVTVNPAPDATITAPATVIPGSTGNAASVANAGAGATYAWSITGGTITAGTGTPNITFTAGGAGTLTLSITVTTAAGCVDTDFVNVGVGCPPPPPQPVPVITTANSVCASSTNNTASFNYGAATWTITNGIITSGQGTGTITYAAGSSGSVGLDAFSSTGGACPIIGHAVKTVTIRDLPTAFLADSVHVCAGTPVTVTAFLTGTAPFTVVWSDGVVQSGLVTAEATRNIIATTTTTFMVDSVTDAFCTNTERLNAMTVFVDPPPVISTQPAHQIISSGTTATLTVGSSSPGVSYQWYQGSVGDTSTPVGTNSASFTTPVLTHTTRYWVRVSNACGSVDSNLAVVTVTGKSRAVRH